MRPAPITIAADIITTATNVGGKGSVVVADGIVPYPKGVYASTILVRFQLIPGVSGEAKGCGP